MSIHAELNDLMTRKGYSQTQVARAIGKSAAVINQYLQGKYAGDVPAIDALARSFINREAEKEKSQKITARFVPTVTSAREWKLSDMRILMAILTLSSARRVLAKP
jgi:DNA transposition AAA+ family ATPase